MATEGYKRKVSAILSADVVGYSLLMEEDEVATIRTIESYRKTISALIQKHNGRVVDSPGDNLLSEFAGVVDAVQCAVEIQNIIKAKNADLPEARRMEFRIGINLGDVIEEGGRIYGESINIAARIEGLADPEGICISGSAYEQIKSKLALGYEDLGEHWVKNISKPVQVYRIPMEPLHVTESGKDKAVSPPEKPSIAVLPFVNMSSDPGQDYFSDGITEEIIAKLSMNSMLTVIARNPTFYYKGKPVKVRQVGQELVVRYVVEGSVRKTDHRIHITAQLIDATTGSHLWAKTYDSELKDIFSLQDDIAQQIVASVGAGDIVAELSRVRRIAPENLMAIDSFWRARELYFQRNKEANNKARGFCERAIDLDPNLTEAYEMMGATHLMDYLSGWNPKPQDALDRVYKFAQKALSLDTYSAGAHDLLAFIYAFRNQKDRAIAAIERAIAIAPNADNLYADMAHILTLLGRQEEAIRSVRKAMHLNPHYPAYYITHLCAAYRMMGQYEEAIALLKKAPSCSSDWIYTYAEMARNYCQLWITQKSNDPEILDEALDIVQKGIALDGSSIAGQIMLNIIYLWKKQYDQAISKAENIIAITPKDGLIHPKVAGVLNHMGRSEESIELLEKTTQFFSIFPVEYLMELGRAYRLIGQREKAVEMQRQIFTLNPGHGMAYLTHLELAILYSELGLESEAKTETIEILKLVPNFSVKVYGQRAPYKDPTLAELDMAALRGAGLK